MNTTEESAQPVSVVISRAVKPGREAEYEEWFAGIAHVLRNWEGCLGIELLRPVAGVQREHVVVLRFETPAHLAAWEASGVRSTWLQQAEPFTEDVRIQHVSGLEGFFTLANTRLALAPPKYKMFLLVSLGLYPLVAFITVVIAPRLDFLPLLIRLLLTTLLAVALMTYLVMPFLTARFRGWLVAGDQPRR